MKIFLILLSLLLLSCSFDSKTGIWKNIYDVELEEDERFKDFETLYTGEKSFNKEVQVSEDFNSKLEPIQKVLIWDDEFYNQTNKLDNFSYRNKNELVFKSKRISKYEVNNNILFDGENIILTDSKGNIIIYSIIKQKVQFKFNFYKKRIKKIKKRLRIIIEDNFIYVADNVGYVYSIDYVNKKLIWAKNYKSPFRSNLKIFKDKIIVSDQDNSLYILNKYDGEKIKIIPTEDVILKNKFINSLAIKNENLLYLNTFGSLYSLNMNVNRIKWFINLNLSSDLEKSGLFYSNQLILQDNFILISTDPYLYVLNKSNGSTLVRKAITSSIEPILSNDKIFLVTKDNLLVCLNLLSGKVNYSININKQVRRYLNTKKQKPVSVQSIRLVNDNLFIFLKSSYVIELNVRGSIKSIKKLPAKLNTLPIFLNDSILYLDKKNKLVILN